MVGQPFLKHAGNLSDEFVVDRCIENPPWQCFDSENYFKHTPPIDPSGMTHFRTGFGEAGCEFMPGLTIKAGLAAQTVAAAPLSIINVNTAVQGTAIALPKDA